jgi:hypothetical protein
MNQYGYMHVTSGRLGFGYHGLRPVVKCADLRKVFDGPIMQRRSHQGMREGMVRSEQPISVALDG